MSYINIVQNINNKKYENKLPFVTFTQDKEAYLAYRKGDQESEHLLRTDLEDEYDMGNHVLANSLWQMAWQYGHSSGLIEVAYHYDDFFQAFVAPLNGKLIHKLIC